MKNWMSFVFIAAAGMFSSACSLEDDFAPEPANVSTVQAGTTLTVSSIDQFNWITGNSSWAQDSRNRLWSSKFIFKSGGRFTYTFKWDNATTYTLNGEYFEGNNGSYSFYALRDSNNGAGSGTQILVEGVITPVSGGRNFRVNMNYGSMAVYAAIVNRQQFFSQSSKRFQTIMTLR